MDIRMKLLIDKKNNNVLFAEADKRFVDFIIHALQLPLAKVVTYLSDETVLCGLGCLHKSLRELSHDYILPSLKRDKLLWPRVASGVPTPFPFSCIKDVAYPDFCLYRCSAGEFGCIDYGSDSPAALCPYCGKAMTSSVTYVPPSSLAFGLDQVGFVKRLVMYVITDDLSVKPMSNSLSYELLKLNVTDLRSVELREVSLDTNKCLELLKASMISKTVLTDVFLRKKEG